MNTVLSNGLRVAVETIPGVQSAAFTIVMPHGTAFDPVGRCGEAALLSEMMLRGAGSRDARGFSEAADAIGFERSVDYGNENITISGAVLSSNLPRAFELTSDLWFAPHLPALELAAAKELCRQDILAIDDSPTEKLFNELQLRALPEPYNRPSKGVIDEIAAITVDDLRARAESLATSGAIFCLAGNIEPAEGLALVEKYFGRDHGDRPYPQTNGGSVPGHWSVPFATEHLTKKDLAQTQIAMAFEALTPDDPDYPVVRLAISALSGGMSGRLFVEVREKRGLVYSVKAFYSATRSIGRIYAYAGTTPPRAQETIAVLDAEFARLAEGLTEDELAKAKTQTKSSVVMGIESPRSRSSTMASDYFYLDRVRSPREIIASFESVEHDRINRYLATHSYHDRYLMTLGPPAEGGTA